MKKNSSLKKFMTNELSIAECKNIKAGTDNRPRNTQTTTQVGNGGLGITCYYDFDGTLLYCVNISTGEIITGGYLN